MKVYESMEFGRMRVVERDGEPWLVAADCYKALGIDSKMVRYYVPDDEVVRVASKILGMKRGAYCLLLSGRGIKRLLKNYKKAKEFRRWIEDVVLAYYNAEAETDDSRLLEKIVAFPEFGIRLLTELKAEREKRVALEQKVGEFTKWINMYYPSISA